MPRKIFALALFILLPSLAAAGEAEDRLRNLFVLKLDDPRVEVEVLPLPANQHAVVLKGVVGDARERDALLRRAEAVAPPHVEVHSRLALAPLEPVPSREAEEVTETDLWPLTYIRSRVTPTGDVSAAFPGSFDNIDALVNAYNRIYGAPGRPAVQRAGSNRLLLHGSRETVTAIKRSLALVDAPWPQVQMNLWAIQVSGSATEVSARIQEIAKDVRRTHDRMIEVQRALAAVATEPEDWKNTGELRKHFDLAGIAIDPDGPLSLNESLVLLLLRPNRQEKVLRLRQLVSGWAGTEADGEPPFHRLERALAAETCKTDWKGFEAFRDALASFKNDRHAPDAPQQLVRTGATVDRLLKSVMDAFAADMNEIFLDPLLAGIQSRASADRDDGISLVGRSRIVVTSGLEAGLTPEMAAFVETARPRPFGRELLDLAFPAAPADGGPLAGAERVLAGLPQAQAALLAAALLGETEPTYSQVAPGIAINARPTVLPDGGSARLTIDARFGVASEPWNAEGREDTWAQKPPAGVTSHHIRTDAAVSAFDLFEISSFSVAASHPRAPFYIPILGRLPWIGPAFQIPRRNKEVHFESLVLINTVILPRALQLNRFYESGPDRLQP